MLSLTKTSSRQREILEVVFRNGWDYMRGLLTGGKASKPQLPSPEVLRNILIELGPVYVKLGQLLSTRPDLLPGRYIDALSTLQAQVPAVAWPEIEVLIRQQLNGPLEEIFAELNPQPVAAGSIAQTHKATLADGRKVAIKVQRPGIDLVIAQDIALIKGLAELVSISDFGSDFDLVALADEFSKALLAELDFTQEASFADQLRRNLSTSRWFDPKQVVVPQIYWNLTNKKLLVMEWLDGVPILSSSLSASQHLAGSRTNGTTDAAVVAEQRRAVTTLLFRAFFQQIYIDGFFHADPHPGNLFYLDDGRVALLDCGMIGRLDPRTQQILTEMLLAIVDIDSQRCAQLTLQLAESSPRVNLARLESDYDRMLRKYYNLSLSEIKFSEVIYEVLDVSRNNKVILPGSMGLYAKALANLEGVARTFDPEINLLDQIKPLITDLFRRQLLGDDPLQTLLRTALDVKSLSLQSPRQLELLLDRMTSETMHWNLTLRDLDPLRRSLDDSANRLSFSIVVGSLIMGAAIISAKAQTAQLLVPSNALFAAASFLGLWLIVSILRSGRLRS
ncbi:AarF/ABC1/UbiB kinase family protein [Desertifilum sp. FACHB-1129]|uniref:ABC transporter n=1 Tax=Desertifilum tharense IPPAS B-1220 TaxID=1781255 RepID=A0A1E5QH44_9CYAN|nr:MULTISPECIES: AarF/ABC1/UbiB kinase family protein [Desertifilum]MDA0209562.1 AarF/ABC1/UbiB kinase family protein [Cyanobacteria bacterium FC1]MBD2312972.1 AarF/ABC1/UbiB kinase family protein [Desertifilum sp. FACHB-1129]MBD2320982.1 AarF/ABC1/UbiB kinase family protein [Desertifilum sp. FACHB-866]MBD2331111.1 AarF/ABC1/UbiB kinase family protein [Desertifilum sp. FACHB-868]OEJ73921.1 ABC transporter [Desertifilum tharense IPPAS B-1220]